LFWTHSRRDIRIRLRVRIGYEAAVLAHHMQNFAEVVAAALGGKKRKKEVFEPQNVAQMKWAVASVFGPGAVT